MQRILYVLAGVLVVAVAAVAAFFLLRPDTPVDEATSAAPLSTMRVVATAPSTRSALAAASRLRSPPDASVAWFAPRPQTAQRRGVASTWVQ